MEKINKAINKAIWLSLFAVLVNIVVIVGIVWIAWHFISKFW